MKLLATACLMLTATSALAANTCGIMSDPGVELACKNVWSACQSANVTDAKNGKTGYQYGEAGQGDGLWKNCIGPLAHGQTPQGLSTVPSAADAKACEKAGHAYRRANPGTCK